MFLTVVFTLIVAKLRGYELKPLLTAYAFYPIFLFEIFGVFLQINIFMGNYEYVKIASIIKTVYMMLYLIPMIKYKLFTQGMIGSAFIMAGTLMNKLVMAANSGKMPIFPTLSKLTGYYKESMFQANNPTHILGSGDTKLNFLADFIDVGYSILSIGDLVIRVFVVMILFYSVKKLQKKKA